MSRIPPPRRPRPARRKSYRQSRDGSLTIRLSGRDDAPLSMNELKDTLYATVQLLLPHAKTYRIKRAALYLTIVDENGTPSSPMHQQEVTLRPYDCAAETFDSPKK